MSHTGQFSIQFAVLRFVVANTRFQLQLGTLVLSITAVIQALATVQLLISTQEEVTPRLPTETSSIGIYTGDALVHVDTTMTHKLSHFIYGNLALKFVAFISLVTQKSIAELFLFSKKVSSWYLVFHELMIYV